MTDTAKVTRSRLREIEAQAAALTMRLDIPADVLQVLAGIEHDAHKVGAWLDEVADLVALATSKLGGVERLLASLGGEGERRPDSLADIVGTEPVKARRVPPGFPCPNPHCACHGGPSAHFAGGDAPTQRGGTPTHPA